MGVVVLGLLKCVYGNLHALSGFDDKELLSIGIVYVVYLVLVHIHKVKQVKCRCKDYIQLASPFSMLITRKISIYSLQFKTEFRLKTRLSRFWNLSGTTNYLSSLKRNKIADDSFHVSLFTCDWEKV